MKYYIITLGIFYCADAIFALGLNLQYGLTGVLNFAYILFFALGAYFAGAFAIGSQDNPTASSVGERFLFGLHVPVPFPADVVLAALVVAALALPVGLTLRRSHRDEFAALVSVAVFQVAYTALNAYQPLFNGNNGLSAIPAPFGASGGLSIKYLWVCVAFLVLTMVVALGITHSPLGRRMRAIRERPDVAAALGVNVFRTRCIAFVIGNGMAGLAGALVVLFVAGWAPPSWAFVETITVFTAVIVGGAGNNWGTLLGTAVISVGIGQAVLFLPQIPSVPYLVPSLQWVCIGVAICVFIAFRPAGLLPERRARLAKRAPGPIGRADRGPSAPQEIPISTELV